MQICIFQVVRFLYIGVSYPVDLKFSDVILRVSKNADENKFLIEEIQICHMEIAYISRV